MNTPNNPEPKPYWQQFREDAANVSHPRRVIAMCVPVVLLLAAIIGALVAAFFLTK